MWHGCDRYGNTGYTEVEGRQTSSDDQQGVLRNLAILATVALIWTASQVAIRGAVSGGEPVSINSLQSISALIVRILTTPLLLIGFALQALNGFLSIERSFRGWS